MNSRIPASLIGCLCLLLAAMALVACGGGDSSGGTGTDAADSGGAPPSRPTGTLRVALAAEPQTIDPSRSLSGHEVLTETAVYDGLLTRTPDNFDELSPALATEWRSNDDATQWTFKLRRGVKFHDGSDFNAAAAKKSLEHYLRETSLYAFAVGEIARIDTPDDSTLVVHYDRPFADFASFMPLVKMMSPRLLEGTPAEVEKRTSIEAVGTGPYILDSFSPSEGPKMHANPDYWGEGPHIEQLDFSPIPEESARNAALLAGEIDLVPHVSPRSLQQLSADPRLETASVDSWTTNLLDLATQKKPLDDVRVRQALAYAIDPAAIARSVKLDQATVTGSLMPPGTLGFVRPEAQYPYDPEKARALLDEAGVEQPVKLEMVTFQGMVDGATMGQALVEQARAAGFDIKLTVVPDAAGNSEIDREQRRWHAFLIANGWVNGGPFHFDYILDHTHITGRVAEMVTQVGTTAPGPERERLIAETQEAMAQELPEIPLFAVRAGDAFTNRLQGHTPPKDGFLPNWSEPYLTGN